VLVHGTHNHKDREVWLQNLGKPFIENQIRFPRQIQLSLVVIVKVNQGKGREREIEVKLDQKCCIFDTETRSRSERPTGQTYRHLE
jgi:hypothetical protein